MPLPRTRPIASLTPVARLAALAVGTAAACGPIGSVVPAGSDGARADGGGGGEPTGSPGDGGGGAGAGGTGGGAAAGGGGAIHDGGGGGQASDHYAPGGYYVQGATIYDSSHRPHLFHGIDRPSLEWAPQGDQLSSHDYELMASWKANVVRLSLNQGFWLEGSSVHSYAYAGNVDQNVQWAEAAGLDVILDLHWSDRGNFATTPAQQRMADEHSIEFWRQVAAKYKDDGRVLFELYNEPHDVSWDAWQSGGPSGDGFTVAGMQQLYDAIRSTGAENLVLVGGLSYAYDLSQVPQHRIQGHNVVYVTHPYNQFGKQHANWDYGFGTLAQTDPVMATEFGDTTGCGTQYYSDFLAYADAHRISWSGWAWYVSGCAFPSIISDWSGTPTAAGEIEKKALLAY